MNGCYLTHDSLEYLVKFFHPLDKFSFSRINKYCYDIAFKAWDHNSFRIEYENNSEKEIAGEINEWEILNIIRFAGQHISSVTIKPSFICDEAYVTFGMHTYRTEGGLVLTTVIEELSTSALKVQRLDFSITNDVNICFNNLLMASKRLKSLTITSPITLLNGDKIFCFSYMSHTIEELTLTHINIITSTSRQWFVRFIRLKVLRLINVEISDTLLRAIFELPTRLKVLQISSDVDTKDFFCARLPEVRRLPTLINLEELHLDANYITILDEDLIEIAKNCRKIKYLVLRFLRISSTALRSALSKLYNLQILELTKLENIHSIRVRRPLKLKKLSISVLRYSDITFDVNCLLGLVQMLPLLSRLELSSHESLPLNIIQNLINITTSRGQKFVMNVYNSVFSRSEQLIVYKSNVQDNDSNVEEESIFFFCERQASADISELLRSYVIDYLPERIIEIRHTDLLEIEDIVFKI